MFCWLPVLWMRKLRPREAQRLSSGPQGRSDSMGTASSLTSTRLQRPGCLGGEAHALGLRPPAVLPRSHSLFCLGSWTGRGSENPWFLPSGRILGEQGHCQEEACLVLGVDGRQGPAEAAWRSHRRLFFQGGCGAGQTAARPSCCLFVSNSPRKEAVLNEKSDVLCTP